MLLKRVCYSTPNFLLDKLIDPLMYRYSSSEGLSFGKTYGKIFGN